MAASYCGIIACNDVPMNPLNNTLLELPVPADLTTVMNDTNTITTTINLGWTPLAVNNSGSPYIVRAVTGRLYMPNSQIPDNEFFPLTDWQIIGLWKKAVAQVTSQPQFINVRKSEQLKSRVITALQDMALTFQTEGMLYNMKSLIQQFVITDDQSDPSAYDATTPICLTPEFNALNITVNVLSYLTQTTTA